MSRISKSPDGISTRLDTAGPVTQPVTATIDDKVCCRKIKTKTMSKNNKSGNEFSNEFTVRRRAWIAKALDSVRGRFEAGDIEVGDEPLQASEDSPKPQLYVVKTDDQG